MLDQDDLRPLGAMHFSSKETFRSHFAYLQGRNTQGVKYVNRINRSAQRRTSPATTTSSKTQ
jgi:hypothetical protein